MKGGDTNQQEFYVVSGIFREPSPDTVESPGSLAVDAVKVSHDDELAPSIRLMEEHGMDKASKNMGKILCRNIDACIGPKLGKCPILGEVGIKSAINEYYWVDDKK